MSNSSNPVPQEPGASETAREYRAVREQAAFFNLSFLAKIRIGGKDRIGFLNGLATNDMNLLSPERGLYTLFPTLKGKILSEAVIYCFSDHLFLLQQPELKEKTIKHLSRYKIGSDVQVEDVSNRFGVISVQGPESFSFLGKLTGAPLPALPEYGCFQAKIGSLSVTGMRHSWSGEPGLDILLPADAFAAVWETFTREGNAAGIVPAGDQTRETLRLEAGAPLYGKELTEEVLPQEAGLEKDAISYTKGCYLGQETIARLHYQGHTNRSLTGLLLEREIGEEERDIFSSGKPAGRITSSGVSAGLKQPVAIGYVHRQFLEPGTRLEIISGDKKIMATVAGFPLVAQKVKKTEET